jgi:serine/threonine protein kinase
MSTEVTDMTSNSNMNMDSFQPFFPFSSGTSVCSCALSKPIRGADEHPHPPLIRLLAIATALDLNILPLMWRPALETLGEGATGRISQSPLDANISLAFKRFSRLSNSIPNLSDADMLSLQYNAMISEVVALNCPEIYDHPNVVNLEGLCWEILKDSEEVWPVMVFRKAELGSLNNFLSLPEASEIDFDDLIGICGEVAKGLRIMHLCGKKQTPINELFLRAELLQIGVIHGDIKPENILVFKSSESDVYGVKITDFGYSCFGKNEDDLVLLPRSRPWEAPEYHPRWFQLKHAKRMDVYSFGLLVLWLLFRDENLVHENKAEAKLYDAFVSWDDAALEILETSKHNGTIMYYALQLVSQKPNLSDDTRLRLQRVFIQSLEHDPDKRAPDMQPFVDLLCENDVLEFVLSHNLCYRFLNLSTGLLTAIGRSMLYKSRRGMEIYK